MKLKWITLAVLGLLSMQAQAANDGHGDAPEVVRHAPPAALENAGLTAQQLTADQVQLNWTDTPVSKTGYVVQRSINRSPWVNVATLPADSTSATLTAPLRAGASYHYRLVAINGAGTGHRVSAAADINVAP